MGSTPTRADAITGVRLLDETTIHFGGVGDCWNMTWAADDRQYGALCDGFGWPGMPLPTFFSSRMYVFDGTPPDVRFAYLPGYPILPCTLFDDEHHYAYYGFGTLAVDGRIYQFLSTRNLPREPRFTGAKLIYSDDLGATWHNQDGSTPVVWETWEERSRANLVFFREPGEAFNMPTLLQMGKDYAANRDGYVYIYSPNGNGTDTMRQLVLCRAPKGELLDRASYRYFAGRDGDGTATWSPAIEDRQPVCTFPEGYVMPLEWRTGTPFALGHEKAEVQPHSWHPSVVYNEGLGVYMMANFGMGVAPGEHWFSRPSYLGIWVADEPWGPWRQIHEDTAWAPAGESAARPYETRISPKWISDDGRSFWLVWTDFQGAGDQSEVEFMNAFAALLRAGRYEEASELQSAAMPYYGFNAQKVEIVM
ncbi:MAG TPA: DUF4185 domain-containing protein [Conexibacter sp.]|nr:DUF4185 domain-containing protein [Conexibacter sp.]